MSKFKLSRILFVLALLASSSCLSPQDPSAITEDDRQILDTELAGEFVKTDTYDMQQPVEVAVGNSIFKFRIFENTAPDVGFGYDILENDEVRIHQPTIPAIPGNKGFSTNEMAEKAAAFVIYKLDNGVFPPTIKKEELDSLGLL